jgi:hypothetical protein
MDSLPQVAMWRVSVWMPQRKSYIPVIIEDA